MIPSPEDSYYDAKQLAAALLRLSGIAARPSLVATFLYFEHLTEEQVAVRLGIGLLDVQQDWQIAKAWLDKEMP